MLAEFSTSSLVFRSLCYLAQATILKVNSVCERSCKPRGALWLLNRIFVHLYHELLLQV